jgi:hypothetical protein
MENLEVKNSSVIVNRFKDMMTKILKNNKKSKILDDPFDTTIICDVKSGWDERFNIDIGYIQDMKIKNFKPNKIKKHIDELYKNEAFNKDENNEIYALLNYFDNMNEYDDSTINLIKESNPKKYNTDLSSWLLINDWFYNKKVLRWNIDDLIKGYLIQNNKKFFLKDTIKNHMTKIDAIYLSKGELNDVSNTIIMKIDGKDNMDTSPEQFNKDLKQAIFEKFYNIEDYDFMKGFKLIYTLSKTTNDIKTLKILNNMLLSNLGIISKLKSQIGTCIDYVKYCDINNIKLDVDYIQSIINYIPQILDSIYEFKIDNIDEFNEYGSITNRFDDNTNKNIIIKTLKFIKNKILNILNNQVIIYAQKNKLYPLDKKWLP